MNTNSITIQPIRSPVTTTVVIPGSKSITNRAVLLAALTKSSVKIKSPLISDDTLAMINALTKMGVKITKKKDEIEVAGSIFDISLDKHKVDADLSGTTIRFLLPILTIIPGVKILFGKPGLNKRPIKDLVDSLTSMGAQIEYLEKTGFPPLSIVSSKILNNKANVVGSISSQYLSALLMFLPATRGGEIKVTGNLVSKSYIDTTIDVMKSFGVKVKNNDYKSFFVAKDQQYTASSFVVEGDYSSASYFAAIAALTGSTITLSNLNPDSTQGDKIFLEILAKMGNKIIYSKDSLVIEGKGVKNLNVDMQNCPDQIQTTAVLAAFAKGKTVISGIETLKVKETDRLSAICTELVKMGIKTEIFNNSLIIYGGGPKGAKINTHGDHRMAMSFTIAGTKIPGIEIENPKVVSKTFPDFWKKLESIGVKIINNN